MRSEKDGIGLLAKLELLYLFLLFRIIAVARYRNGSYGIFQRFPLFRGEGEVKRVQVCSCNRFIACPDIAMEASNAPPVRVEVFIKSFLLILLSVFITLLL